MKTTWPLLIMAFLCAQNIVAQSNMELLVDSQHYWTCYPNYENPESEFGQNGCDQYAGDWYAYSYDNENRLTQIRRAEPYRHNYYYSNDTVFQINEQLDSLGSWKIRHRYIGIMKNDLPVSELGQLYNNGTWKNSTFSTYSYDDFGRQIAYYIQIWSDEVWKASYGKTDKYDHKGNHTEESELYVYDNDTLEFSRGMIYEYDAYNHLIKSMFVNNKWEKQKYFPAYTEWIYGKDHLLDSMIVYSLNFQNGNYDRTSYSTYQQLGYTKTIESTYYPYDENSNWKKDKETVSYKTGNIYNSNPDYQVTFIRPWNSSTLEEKIRTRYEFKELTKDSVYFNEREYVYYDDFGGWQLTSNKEEWYHLKSVTNGNTDPDNEKQVSIYPNPGLAGMRLNIQNISPDESGIEVLIFNLEGKLVSTERLSGARSFIAPEKVGTYIIMLRKNNSILSVSKNIIQ